MRWGWTMSIALGAALAGCADDNDTASEPGIRETGYLRCRDGGERCDGQWLCTGADGAESCVDRPATCEQPTCDCGGLAICGDAPCRDERAGFVCEDPDASGETDGAADAEPPPADAEPPAVDGAPGPLDAGPLPVDGTAPPAIELRYEGPPPPVRLTVRGAVREGVPTGAELTWRVLVGGRPPREPTRVRFTVRDDGVATLDREEVETDAEGFARVQVRARALPGVTAISGEALSAGLTARGPEVEVKVLPSPPSAKSLHLACEDEVQAAFVRQAPAPAFAVDPTVNRCTLQVAHRVGGILAGETVRFASEAGILDDVVETDENGRAVARLLATAPAPVALPGGPAPADGRVTVIAIVRGEEAFVDRDGDFAYDPAIDLFPLENDLAEPFIDANENGVWDEGEEFRDGNGNGVWDPGNGQWDADAAIWSATTVTWVGPADPEGSDVTVECGDACATDGPLRPDCPASDLYLAPGGRATLGLRVTDANGNCVAAGGEGTVTVESTSATVQADVDAVPLAESCTPEGARRLELVLRDTSLPGAPAEPFRVTVTTEYPLADGRRDRITHTLSGCH